MVAYRELVWSSIVLATSLARSARASCVPASSIVGGVDVVVHWQILYNQLVMFVIFSFKQHIFPFAAYILSRACPLVSACKTTLD
jgi:hypothetical protein